jgi:hypothetical protein
MRWRGLAASLHGPADYSAVLRREASHQCQKPARSVGCPALQAFRGFPPAVPVSGGLPPVPQTRPKCRSPGSSSVPGSPPGWSPFPTVRAFLLPHAGGHKGYPPVISRFFSYPHGVHRAGGVIPRSYGFSTAPSTSWSTSWPAPRSVDAELVAFRILHHNREMIHPVLLQDAESGRARIGQPLGAAGDPLPADLHGHMPAAAAHRAVPDHPVRDARRVERRQRLDRRPGWRLPAVGPVALVARHALMMPARGAPETRAHRAGGHDDAEWRCAR